MAEPPPENVTLAVRKRLVMIVDDLAENLQVLAGHMSEEGHDVVAASNGMRALALARNRKPDLILLDIMMPGMDGFEVCRILKADPESMDIPIIFLTARTEMDDVVEGLRLGAVDYVTKPFRPPELLARVRTHLDLKASRDLLYTYNRHLERIATRLKKLNEDKNRFLGIVSHDIRGAFGNVVTISKMASDGEIASVDQAFGFLETLSLEAEHMIALAENLLNIDAIERREVRLHHSRISPDLIVEFAVNANRRMAEVKEIRIITEQDDCVIEGDLTACRQILSNLISNAVKYSPPQSEVKITIRQENGRACLTVADQGPGISIENQKKLFQPFARFGSGSREHSVGLGLSIVKLMAEAMGGEVNCESALGKGTTFRVTLPLASSDH